MAVSSALLNVEDFSRLPEASGGVRQELHDGELIELPPSRSYIRDFRSGLSRCWNLD